MKIEVEITKEEIEFLKQLKNYFGEHDKTLFEHKAYPVLDSLVKKLNIQPVSCSAIDIVKWIADCPYVIDEATVPKMGIDANKNQVVGNISLSYVKWEQLRLIAQHYR